MIQRFGIAMLGFTIWGCGMMGRSENKMNENLDIRHPTHGSGIGIVDNVNAELWRLHPALNFLKSELSEMSQAQGLYLGGDSLMKSEAALFYQEIETEYMSYEPNVSILKLLDSAIRSGADAMHGKPCTIEILMLGGNWCSDTRVGLPRLCKVIDVLMSSTEGNTVVNKSSLNYSGVQIRMDYRRVNRDKKLIDGALAADVFFGGKQVLIGRVPEVCVSRSGFGNAAVGGNPGVDFAAEPQYLGSILEMPLKSWEEDLLGLMKKQN